MIDRKDAVESDNVQPRIGKEKSELQQILVSYALLPEYVR